MFTTRYGPALRSPAATRGPHPLPRLRTLAVNPSPLVAGSPPETSGAVSRLPIGIPCLHVLCLKLLGLDWYLFLMRLPVFWCSLLHCARSPALSWVGLLRGLPLLRPCPTQSFTSSLCLPDILCPLPRWSVSISWTFCSALIPPSYFLLLPPLIPRIFSPSCSSFLISHPNREGVEDLLEIVVCFIRISFKALVFVYTWGRIGDFVNMWVVINCLEGKGEIFPEGKKNALEFKLCSCIWKLQSCSIPE